MSLTSGLDPVLDFLLNGLTHSTGWQIFIYTMIVTHITIAGVTIFLHRCQAHRALDLHAIPSHFFRFWLWMTTGMVTKEWAAIHRKHHAKCETEEDPHSPVTRGIDKVVYEGAELYRIEARNTETIEKYGHGTPDDWIERNVYTKHSALGVSMLLVINIVLFGVLGLSVRLYRWSRRTARRVSALSVASLPRLLARPSPEGPTPCARCSMIRCARTTGATRSAIACTRDGRRRALFRGESVALRWPC